ncbi:chromosome segregation ATPase [Alkalibacillus flavidus]|uniref:Chromosome segregation ATPase n=1 Tax=Alkalibacillus flavidus TaxID=546021 RepID=A0ABV2KVM7_9BACI
MKYSKQLQDQIKKFETELEKVNEKKEKSEAKLNEQIDKVAQLEQQLNETEDVDEKLQLEEELDKAKRKQKMLADDVAKKSTSKQLDELRNDIIDKASKEIKAQRDQFAKEAVKKIKQANHEQLKAARSIHENYEAGVGAHEDLARKLGSDYFKVTAGGDLMIGNKYIYSQTVPVVEIASDKQLLRVMKGKERYDVTDDEI